MLVEMGLWSENIVSQIDFCQEWQVKQILLEVIDEVLMIH